MTHRPISHSWGGYGALSVTAFHIGTESPCRQRSISVEFWAIVEGHFADGCDNFHMAFYVR